MVFHKKDVPASRLSYHTPSVQTPNPPIGHFHAIPDDIFCVTLEYKTTYKKQSSWKQTQATTQILQEN